MSHMPSSQAPRQRTGRKPVVASPRQNPQPKRLNQKDLDSSCHRLSRVPQKFNPNKGMQSDKNESYAVNYFKKNPDQKDSTPPDKKLEEIAEQLNSEELDTSERFTLLVRQKALRYIMYGENSAEALRSHASIGFFYNENHRPASALRHLNKARQLEEQNDIERDEMMMIDIETAEAYLSLHPEKKSEITRCYNNADAVLSEWADEPIEDPKIKYRRDLSLGRIYFAKGEVDKSIERYEEAQNSLQEVNSDDDDNVERAVLLTELGHVYKYDKKDKKAGDCFQKAYDIYTNLEMEEDAKNVEPFLPTGDEVDEEDENDAYQDEENEEENANDDDETNSESANAQSNRQIDQPEEQDEEKSTSNKEDNTEDNNSEKSNNDEDQDKSEENQSEENKNEEEHGRAENLLNGFGNALLGNSEEKNESNEDTDKNLDDDDNSEEKKTESEQGGKLSSTNDFEDTDNAKSTSENPKLSDTGGFDEFE